MTGCSYPVPSDEDQRLAALRSYQIVDTPPAAEFDNVVRLAAHLFQVPTALVSFVEADRQFFKARIGLDACQTSRDVSFCAHALVDDKVLVVPDARCDKRFADNPLVTGTPFIRFYAGAPLVASSGHKIGTLCIIDSKPRESLSSHQEELLRNLAEITMDHLERLRLDHQKRASLQIAAAMPDAIVCSERDSGLITFWNASAERMFGLSRGEAMFRPMKDIIADECYSVFADHLSAVQTGLDDRSAVPTIEIFGVRSGAIRFPMELSLASWGEGAKAQIGSIIRDVTERHQTEERLRFSTYCDRLTGLPNRGRFLQHISEAQDAKERFTVLKIGIDKFKSINGSMGMAAGDLILKIAADRIAAAAKPTDFVARLAGDEFGFIRLGSDDPCIADVLAAHMFALFTVPFDVHGSKCHLEVSIGIVLSPPAAPFADADAVLKGALLALNHAKAEGGRRAEVFRPTLGLQAYEFHTIEEELRHALSQGQFELHYQPQVRLSDGSIVGAEALLRWRHPQRGLLLPAAFISILEACAAAPDVGRWIMRAACEFAADLVAAGSPIRMGVNLFASQLRDRSFYSDVIGALSAAHLPPNLLELEITETTVLGLDGSVIDPLAWLRDQGVKIAFDDYGTGFASLSLLKRYPLTRLKIDRAFVSDLERDRGDVAIVKAVLALGASLGLEVIAEGIETAEQGGMLASFGCREAQGYYFGKPMPEAEFRSLLCGGRVSDAA